MSDINHYEHYAKFISDKNEVVNTIDLANELISRLNMDQFCSNLDKLSEKVRNETFKVQIVGTFKNGKSTFIKSLLL